MTGGVFGDHDCWRTVDAVGVVAVEVVRSAATIIAVTIVAVLTVAAIVVAVVLALDEAGVCAYCFCGVTTIIRKALIHAAMNTVSVCIVFKIATIVACVVKKY
jgi:hypothetical protein